MRISVLFILSFISVLVGQLSFTAHTITTSADGAFSVYAVDVDGDGDMDVLSASHNDDKIAWYENGNSWAATSITTSADYAISVYAVDMDGNSVSGTGNIANIVFNTLSAGQSEVSISTASRILDPDAKAITLNGYGKGTIDAQ